jgi:hypothetical protein
LKKGGLNSLPFSGNQIEKAVQSLKDFMIPGELISAIINSPLRMLNSKYKPVKISSKRLR